MRAESVVISFLAVTGLMSTCDAGTTATIKLCGRKLTLFMSQICHAYNSPSWDDDPSVIDHAQARKKRELGIADVCCTIGCTWTEISEYCLISPQYEKSNPFDVLGAHMIEDRSAEKTASVETPAEEAVAAESDQRSDVRRPARRSEAREVGRARRRGYGRGRCWCRRRRRSGRRHDSLMGNMDSIKNVARAAPVVGTVSPLLTWARTQYTDLPPTDKDRYAYVVYAQP